MEFEERLAFMRNFTPGGPSEEALGGRGCQDAGCLIANCWKLTMVSTLGRALSQEAGSFGMKRRFGTDVTSQYRPKFILPLNVAVAYSFA